MPHYSSEPHKNTERFKNGYAVLRRDDYGGQTVIGSFVTQESANYVISLFERIPALEHQVGLLKEENEQLRNELSKGEES